MRKVVPIDLSKYSSEERLPGNVVSILKNALIIYNGNAKKVAKDFNISIDKVNEVLLANYMQINTIVSTQVKSQDVDAGINDTIKMLKNHVSEMKKESISNNTPLLKDSTVSQLTRITDRLLTAKSQYINAYDKMINEMIDQDKKERQLQVLENGPIEDSTEYQENQNSVVNMLKKYGSKKDKKIILVNIKTYETKIFTNYKDADEFLGTGGHLRDVAARKYPYKETWIVNMDNYYNED